jgi:3-phenylpropionate/trans-cinnamate dioxygenase ferredoxin reductase component
VTAPIIIVGAGQGGLQAAESLRSGKYQGSIVMYGDEPYAPYMRPPLSKAFLLGEYKQEQLTIRQPAVFEKKEIQLNTGVKVTGIDAAAKTITLDSGEQLAYSKLVLATGSRARIPPIVQVTAKGVHPLRSLDDTLGIAQQMPSANHLVIVGGGFIGLEMAAVACKLGKKVTVVEFAERLMARVVSPMISEYFRELHQQHGCEILLNSAVSEIITEEGQTRAVRLSNGTELKADMVVLGVGILPNQELAQDAGIECDNGILIDSNGQTSDDDIYALGDCTAQRLPDGSLRRLESVQNAVEMAKAVAANILGSPKPFDAAPWFWSDQYDIKLQMVGLCAGYDEAVVRGDAQSASFSWMYFRKGQLIAIDSINCPADHMAGRKLLAARNNLTLQQAADSEFALKQALLD